MAIIQGLPGLEVTIFTGGRTAKEYKDPSETSGAHKRPRVITKYIECKDNEPFRIHLKATDEYSWGFKNHILNFGAVIDGVWAKGELCRQEYTKEEDWEREISYRVVKDPNDYARYILQEFAFSTIIKTDNVTDKQHESDMETMERLGTIEVKVHRATVQDNGSIFVPSGNHPKDFIISREAVKGKAKSHGTKFTRTQPAVKPQYIKCLALREDDGPIAIFRFKYRSREALVSEGISPDPQQPFHWLVEIADDEKAGGKRGNSGSNRHNTLSNSKEAEMKIKKEKEDGIPSSASSTTSHNNSAKRAEPSQLKRSVFPIIKLSYSGTQNAASTQNNSEPKSTGSRVKDPRRKLAHKDLTCRKGTKTVLGNNGPQDKSRDDDNDIVQDIETPPGLCSCDTALPSIERIDNAVEVKINSEQKSISKSNNTVTQHTGKSTIIKQESPGSSPRTVNVTGVPRPEVGASNPIDKSLKVSPETKDERRKLTKLGKPKLGKEKLKRKIQELRGRKMQIKLSYNRQDNPGNVATPTTSVPPPTRTISATSLLNSMLPPLPPSSSSSTNCHTSASNNTRSTIPSRVSQPFLSYATSNQTGMDAVATNPLEPSTSKVKHNNRNIDIKVRTGAATHTDKEKRTAPKAAAKRKASEIIPSGSIHRPCVPKQKKIKIAAECKREKQ
ncbi:hypothetical protein F4680DRAFT_465387 [Xylaria scruposa]|nr:hypothetical protein F4680DRAFT_465387 [Xylaria scruposa]